jgi:thymidine kinase
VVVGDVTTNDDEVGYEVLCRRHHIRRVTAATSGSGTLSPDVLPFGSTDTVCSNAGA